MVAEKTYFISFDIQSDVALPRVYIKAMKTGNNDAFLEIPALAVAAGTQTVSGIFKNTGSTLLAEMDKILFDLGGNPANAHVVISNITICDDYSGNTPVYTCGGTNVGAVSYTTGTPFYAPGWTASTNFTETWASNALTLQLNDATFEAWQAQFTLLSSPVTLVAEKTYFLSFDIQTNVALPRVYMKVLKDEGNDNFLEIPATAVPVGTQTISAIFKNTGATTITEFNKILFDFGGNPANANIVISNISICDDIATGLSNAQANAISIYPNPVKNVLYINGLEGSATVQVVSLVGNVLINTVVDNGSIDVSKLPQGIYVVKINGQLFKVSKQ
jgi:hypothetical protein